MKKFAILAAAAAFAAPAAMAAGTGTGGSLAGYVVSEDADGPDGTGFGLKGHLGFGAPFATLEWQSVTLEQGPFESDLDQLRIGGGYGMDMNTQTSLFGRAEWIDLGGDADDDGFGVHGGLKFAATPAVTLKASVGFLKFDDDDGTELLAGAGFAFTKQLGAFVDYRLFSGDSDLTDLRAGVSFAFGG